MTIEEIGILLSLLVTIIGWSVTALYQKRILERQIIADKEKEVRQLIIPARVQQLQEIKNWLQTGLGIVSQKLSGLYQDAAKQYANWKSQYFKVYLLSSQLELWFPDYHQIESRKLQEVIADYAQCMEQLFTDITEAEASQIAFSIGKTSLTAVQQLDSLIELSAAQEIDKKRRKHRK